MKIYIAVMEEEYEADTALAYCTTKERALLEIEKYKSAHNNDRYALLGKFFVVNEEELLE